MTEFRDHALSRALIDDMPAIDRAQMVLGCSMPKAAQEAMSEPEIKKLVRVVAEAMVAHASMIDTQR